MAPPRWHGHVTVETMLESICAIHLSSYVSSPVHDRGGLMIVGPPGQLKTTLINVIDENYHNAIASSNLNTQTLMKVRHQFANGEIRTLVLPDVQAIYAGDPRTAARLEQMLMQLSGEGSKGASWEDTRYQKFKSRCTVIGAMTPRFHEKHVHAWEDSGFLRRFLWSSFVLEDPDALLRALEQWRRADIGSIHFPALPVSQQLPDSLTTDERREIRRWLKHQPGPHEVQFTLLCRATAALRWHYATRKIKRNALDTLRGFAETLQKDAALLRI